MDTATHIAVGNDAGAHFRIIDGWWHLCRPLHDPERVTVPETLRSLEMLSNIGSAVRLRHDTPGQPTDTELTRRHAVTRINVWPAKWRNADAKGWEFYADQHIEIPARRARRARLVYQYARSKGLAAPFARLIVVQSIEIGQP